MNKISFVLPNLRGGGAERICVDLARIFAELGHSVEFVLMSATGELIPEVQTKFKLVNLNALKTRNVPIALARYLKEHKPDALIAHMWPLTTAAVIGRALSNQRCKLLLVEHCMLSIQYETWGILNYLMLRSTLTFNSRYADVIAAVSEGAANDLAALVRLPAEKIKVLHNPIPQRPMPNTEARERAIEWWGKSSGERILNVGSFKDQKDHPLLLRAFALLARPDAKLMLLGHGENEKMLRSLSVELGIANRVIFPGFYPDPSPFYATADLFVLSSVYEGLPTVLIEALSFGLPIVSTDCPSGPAEILENGRFGRLVPVGDAQALAQSIDEALSAPLERAELMRRSLDFAPEIAARKYLNLLDMA